MHLGQPGVPAVAVACAPHLSLRGVERSPGLTRGRSFPPRGILLLRRCGPCNDSYYRAPKRMIVWTVVVMTLGRCGEWRFSAVQAIGVGLLRSIKQSSKKVFLSQRDKEGRSSALRVRILALRARILLHFASSATTCLLCGFDRPSLFLWDKDTFLLAFRFIMPHCNCAHICQTLIYIRTTCVGGTSASPRPCSRRTASISGPCTTSLAHPGASRMAASRCDASGWPQVPMRPKPQPPRWMNVAGRNPANSAMKKKSNPCGLQKSIAAPANPGPISPPSP